MNLKMNDVTEIFNLINNSKNICIAGHKAPDGDCIGSVMALYEFIKPLNKKLTVCIDGIIPYNYKQFMDEDILLKEYNNEEFDLLFVLDCSDKERLGKFKDVFNNIKTSVCIDHHKTNEGFADINIIDTEISSTGELLYDILKISGRELTKKIATNIYIAILTDTGKFSYSNTNGETHKKTAELIELGVDISQIDNIIYNSKPSNIVKAYIECISSLELYYSNKFAITCITNDILERNNAEMGDIDGVVEFLREIEEVEVSCVLKEYDSSDTKVSLRAKNNIDVSHISVKYGGGGHAKAAGFEIKETIENTKKILIETFKEYFQE
ncbi:bifunctional oligoribonuclease/PAP phosphatase NrnA [Sedimentibacter hydroxybenzoicus DSM 7310]|uniref:Bifunctional oligoribonuclease/PAP phosphatase NrnA n=1 Tax=Sedimentibacter hydroxybenzoicus DSM 7310 TaxID=1123245 RepID=A0A974BJF0_SEDHY|nr:bifunctional oligoribonuclease/PAP phosphatase NrnA [Sedimentibacter hydroxybenzoicus]NYB74370.1 bifunctional oligoribonuclease/PAP phosphatase NrnA [Sedimentibacter hydroxybenzoicus DSM 7310]